MNDKEKKEIEKNFNKTLDDKKKQKYILRLYVAGATGKSQMAIENIHKIAEEYLEGQYELEVIDIYQQPDMIKRDQIIAAPTLIKKLPLPLRKIIGDLSNKERVLVGLELWEKKS
jgi:circadian clock protein KaiB